MIDLSQVRAEIEAAGPRAVVKAIAKMIAYELRPPGAEEIMAAMSEIADRLPELPEPTPEGPLPF
jgi:hypothetical protein